MNIDVIYNLLQMLQPWYTCVSWLAHVFHSFLWLHHCFDLENSPQTFAFVTLMLCKNDGQLLWRLSLNCFVKFSFLTKRRLFILSLKSQEVWAHPGGWGLWWPVAHLVAVVYVIFIIILYWLLSVLWEGCLGLSDILFFHFFHDFFPHYF